MKGIMLFLSGILLLGSFIVQGQSANRPVPATVPTYEFILHDSTYQGYFLTTPFHLNKPIAQPLPAMILDSKGCLFWYMLVDARNLLDFKFDAKQQLYQYVKYRNPQQVQFSLMDTDFNLVDSFTTTNGVLPDVHDFQISSKNTFLLSGIRDTILDLSAFQFDGVQGSATTRAIGFVVQEFDAEHKLLFQWNSNEHIHPGTSFVGYGYNPVTFDYCHGNAIEEDTDGNLLISFRNLDAVYKIDRQTGDVLWELGGKNSTFTFANDLGFSGQHDIRRLPNGNISLFDNANMAAAPQISRAVEYQLDTLNWIATKVWEYQYAPPFFSSAMGNHQTTADRRHLINFGLNFRPTPSFVLTNDAGDLHSELFFQDSFMSYRSFLFDLPTGNIQRPAITCTSANGIVKLTAPSGHERYAWSTGETTAEISVQKPGTYQVWVPFGVGMLGSEPYEIQDLNMACALSSISEAALESRSVVGYYDLLGRKVAAPEFSNAGGQLYIVQYADGRVKLQWFLR